MLVGHSENQNLNYTFVDQENKCTKSAKTLLVRSHTLFCSLQPRSLSDPTLLAINELICTFYDTFSYGGIIGSYCFQVIQYCSYQPQENNKPSVETGKLMFEAVIL